MQDVQSLQQPTRFTVSISLNMHPPKILECLIHCYLVSIWSLLFSIRKVQRKTKELLRESLVTIVWLQKLTRLSTNSTKMMTTLFIPTNTRTKMKATASSKKIICTSQTPNPKRYWFKASSGGTFHSASIRFTLN